MYIHTYCVLGVSTAGLSIHPPIRKLLEHLLCKLLRGLWTQVGGKKRKSGEKDIEAKGN